MLYLAENKGTDEIRIFETMVTVPDLRDARFGTAAYQHVIELQNPKNLKAGDQIYLISGSGAIHNTDDGTRYFRRLEGSSASEKEAEELLSTCNANPRNTNSWDDDPYFEHLGFSVTSFTIEKGPLELPPNRVF